MTEKQACSNCTLGSCAISMLSDDELGEMERNASQAGFRKGEIIRQQDAPMDSVIYLRQGYVKEFIRHHSVADQVIQLIRPRSYIGLQMLYTNTVSAFAYQSITDVEVCFIEKNTFSGLIRRNGNFAGEILTSLSHESMSNHKRFLSLNQTQTFGKVAGLLVYLSEEVYENSEFELQLKRAELAQMVASTRESVTRALKWFHNEGIIFMHKNLLVIEQKDRLLEIAKRG